MERVYALFPILAEKRRLAAGGLSGGQQQMLAVGRAMMGDPKLLCLTSRAWARARDRSRRSSR